MHPIKYEGLGDAFRRDKSRWRKYERDCDHFARAFRKRLAQFLLCSEKLIGWVRFEKPEDPEETCCQEQLY
jgi:hypothetical protein